MAVELESPCDKQHQLEGKYLTTEVLAASVNTDVDINVEIDSYDDDDDDDSFISGEIR